MYSQQETQRIEIKPAKWRMYGLVAGMIAFSVAGVLIFLFSESLVDRCMGIVAVVFFGGGGALWVSKWLRNQHFRVAVAPVGLEIYLVGAGSGAGWQTIPWRDIEEFGTLKQGSAEFTTVKLRSYQSLLAGISPEQAKDMMRMLPALRAAVHGATGLATVSGVLEQAVNFVEMGTAVSEIKNLEGTLRLTREQCGAEFLLPWSARDRSAGAFALFLEHYRRTHT